MKSNTPWKIWLIFLSLTAFIECALAQLYVWNELPVRALLLSAPDQKDVPLFCQFIRQELAPQGVNTLVVRFGYRYQFETHPELADFGALSKGEVKQIDAACKDAGVKLIPKMNLLAHQSDKNKIFPLLAKYPQFDESPDYNPPSPWKDGGPHDFYTKSLCPLHPDLYQTLFPLMDELIEICGADAFHVGLDEAWIIAYPKCPRCGGRDPAEIFAGHVTKLHDHLAAKQCRMWMWSDRLIDGKTSGLLAWQASMNNTWRAIEMIPKDILICDWKYEDAPPTPGFFAIKGFDVLASPCSKADVALDQLAQVYAIRKNGTREEFSKTISSRMVGIFETSWMSAGGFMEAYYSTNSSETGLAKRNADTFKAVFAEIRKQQP
jgi:hypothetical protein